jgi:hypothetical protein
MPCVGTRWCLSDRYTRRFSKFQSKIGERRSNWRRRANPFKELRLEVADVVPLNGVEGLNVEMTAVEVVSTTRPDHRQAESLREAGLELHPIPMMRDVRD